MVPTHALEAATADVAFSLSFALYFFEHVCSTFDVPLGDGVVYEFGINIPAAPPAFQY